MSLIKAVLFDCDGTLVDTELLCAVAVTQVFKKYGVDYTPQSFLETFFGMSHSSIIAKIKAEKGIEIPLDASMDAYSAITHSMIPSDMKVFEKSVSYVRGLAARGIKMAVVSNGDKNTVMYELEVAGYLEIIPRELVFTACDFKNPKPAPDMYLGAAKALGVGASECVVVEDSPNGARAGLSAGMRVVGYTGFAHHPEAQAKALKNMGVGRIINDLTELDVHLL